MTFWEALLPLVGLLAGGGAVIWAVRRYSRTKKTRGLPTDPLCDFFVYPDDKI